jgi:hypothetical protein
MDFMPPTKPPGHIWLGDAFEQAFQTLEDYQALIDALNVPVQCENDPSYSTYDAAPYDAARDRVEIRLRDALADGELRALVYPPGSQVIGELPDREKWRVKPDAILFGLVTNVDSMTNPGPETGGLPVMLDVAQFEQWLSLEAGASPPKKRKPRKRGAVSLASRDKVHIIEMRRLMQSGVAPSINAAAQMVFSRGGVAGHGTEESKIRRLREHYSKAYED